MMKRKKVRNREIDKRMKEKEGQKEGKWKKLGRKTNEREKQKDGRKKSNPYYTSVIFIRIDIEQLFLSSNLFQAIPMTYHSHVSTDYNTLKYMRKSFY